MGKWDNIEKDSLKGIIGYEFLGHNNVIDARYGTFGEFKELVKDLNAKHKAKYGVPAFKKDLGHGGMDSWEGINYWIIARGYRGRPDLTFYYFVKDGGQRVIPNSKLSEYAERYEPFLKKRK